ncbi:hypothetical protein [Azospirillum sp. sgz302134]
MDQLRAQDSPALSHREAFVLPPSLVAYIRRYSGKHQIGLSVLSAMVFLLSVVPLELQRRIVNDAISSRAISSILWLAAAYVGVALLEGAIKLALNIYRGWVSEAAVRHLRTEIHGLHRCVPEQAGQSEREGLEIALILSEAEPVGNFVGISLSEPLLQGGILLSVFVYMSQLQPEVALPSLSVFLPQLVFVPLMQRAINRRAETRIRILRSVSGGMIDHGEASDKAQADRIQRVFALNMGIYKLKFGMNFLMNLMHHLGIAIVLGIGGWYAAKGRIDVGAVVACISGLTKIIDPWGDLINWYREATINRMKYRLIATAAQQLSRGGATGAAG